MGTGVAENLYKRVGKNSNAFLNHLVMKRNKIAIFVAVALLTVATVFGARKIRHINDITAFIKINGVCTPITCGTTGSVHCRTVTVYTDDVCTIEGNFWMPNGIQ